MLQARRHVTAWCAAHCLPGSIQPGTHLGRGYFCGRWYYGGASRRIVSALGRLSERWLCQLSQLAQGPVRKRADCQRVSCVSAVGAFLEAGEAPWDGRVFGEGSICSAARAPAALSAACQHTGAPCSSIARLGSPALESHACRRGGARVSRAAPELSNIRSDTMVWLHAMKEANAIIPMAKADISTCSHLKPHTHTPATCPCYCDK